MNLEISSHDGFKYETEVKRVNLGAFFIEVEQIKNMDQTIDRLFQHYQERGLVELFDQNCPYFGVLWPAGLDFAKFLFNEYSESSADARNLQFLEIGCGLAVPAMVLLRLGYNIELADHHPDVEVFLKKNVSRNQLSSARYFNLDWKEMNQSNKYDVILGSDILYDRTQPASVFGFLQNNLSGTGMAIIADPGRIYWNEFERECQLAGWKFESIRFNETQIAKIRRPEKSK